MEVERKGQSVARARSSESEKKVDKRFGDARARRLGLDFADARARARRRGATRPGGVASERGARCEARDSPARADTRARLAARSRRAETTGTGATSRRASLFVSGFRVLATGQRRVPRTRRRVAGRVAVRGPGSGSGGRAKRVFVCAYLADGLRDHLEPARAAGRAPARGVHGESSPLRLAPKTHRLGLRAHRHRGHRASGRHGGARRRHHTHRAERVARNRRHDGR